MHAASVLNFVWIFVNWFSNKSSNARRLKTTVIRPIVFLFMVSNFLVSIAKLSANVFGFSVISNSFLSNVFGSSTRKSANACSFSNHLNIKNVFVGFV